MLTAQLSGSIPPEIGKLKGLTELYLDNQQVGRKLGDSFSPGAVFLSPVDGASP